VGRHRLLPGALGAAFLATACGCGTSSLTASSSSSNEVLAPTAAATSSGPSLVVAIPARVPPLVIAQLPRIELENVDATAVCDADPTQAAIDAGQSRIDCSDGLTVALAAVSTVTKDPVTHIYLHRPMCATTPCSEDDLSTAHITVWTATQAFAVQLDARLETLTGPSVADDAVWPAGDSDPSPAMARPSIAGAPPEVARRDPYPFCGRAESGHPTSVVSCFRNALLAGSRVEMIEGFNGTEGGGLLAIFRYAGHGRLSSYQHDETTTGDGRRTDTWRRADGAMVLGTASGSWDFDPWFSVELAS
jgi:hypothetical protein